MYTLLKKGKLQKLMSDAIRKAGSYNKLAKAIKIYRSKVWYYKTHDVALQEERLNIILNFIGIKLNPQDIEKKLPDNWRQIIGGKNCVKEKRAAGTLNKQLAQSRKNIKKTLGDWHREMRKKDVKAYYLSQYDKFKKVAGYKLETENGEKVRNKLERDIANLLKKLGISYQYEPLIKAGGKYFFPDFFINDKIIIECTMWRGEDKAIKLKEKLGYLENKYKVYVVIPAKLERYYSKIQGNLILGAEKFEELAKTFK